MAALGSFLDATAFLTRVPLPARRDFDLARAAWAFPLVGAATGLLLGTVGVLTTGLTGWLVAAVLVVLVEVLITGALHLDGLADCADGTGGRDRESRLRIMKDHAVGVYGVCAVVLDLLLKAALVGALLAPLEAGAGAGVGPEAGAGAGTGVGAGVGAEPEARVGAEAGVLVVAITTVAWTLSRTAMLPLAARLPYARDAGTGRALVEGLTPRRVLAALGVAGTLVVGVMLTAAAVTGPASPGSLPGSLAESWPGTTSGPGGVGLTLLVLLVHLLAALGAVVLATWLTARWARRTLGGVTGDVLGAAAEVTLLAALLAVLLAGPLAGLLTGRGPG